MNNSHDNPAYQEGRQSYFAKKGRYENPYPSSSPDHDIFERGWSQALKKAPQITTREPKKPKTETIQKTRKEAEKELMLQKAKKDYLKNKGG